MFNEINPTYTAATPSMPQINPLIDFEADIENKTLSEKLLALNKVFHDDVARGMGLVSLILQTSESTWQWTLRHDVEAYLSKYEDIEEAAVVEMHAYLAREHQLVWASQALNIPGEVSLEYIRRQVIWDNCPESFYVEPDIEMDFDLLYRHGACPIDFSSLARFPKDILYYTKESQFKAFEEIFQPALKECIGLDDLLCKKETILAKELIEQFDGYTEDLPEIIRSHMDSLVRQEAELTWAATELQLAPGEIIRFITDNLQ